MFRISVNAFTMVGPKLCSAPVQEKRYSWAYRSPKAPTTLVPDISKVLTAKAFFIDLYFLWWSWPIPTLATLKLDLLNVSGGG